MPFTVSSSRDAHGKRKRRYPKEGHTTVQASRQLSQKQRDARAKEQKVSTVVNRLLTQWQAHLLGGSNNAMSYAGVKALVAMLTRGHPFRRNRSDVCSLDARWYAEERVSHVFAFDARFGAETLTKMYRSLGQVPCPLVGCNPVSTRAILASRFFPGGRL